MLLVRWLFVTNRVLTENQVMMVAANDDGGFILFVAGTVVQYDVSLEAVAMGAGFIAFFSKLDAVFGVGDDSVAGERVVRAATADRDAHVGILQQLIVLEAATLDGDTYEHPAVAIAPGDISPDQTVVRVAAGMNAHPRIILDRTTFDGDVLGVPLKADPVAIVIPHGATAH